MYRSKNLPVNEPVLPEGFYFKSYQEGDEVVWAAIETAVSEFENEGLALNYFEEKFAPYSKDLRTRLLFVVDSSGEKVGTCSAWWKESPNGVRYPLVHWVAVKPGYQGKGLAKAMVNRTLKLLQELEKNSPIYLHTQTWSYAAIHLYQKLGFEITDNNLDGSPNVDYQKAMSILASIQNKKTRLIKNNVIINQ